MALFFIGMIALTAASFLSVLGSEPFIFDMDDEIISLNPQGSTSREIAERQDEVILEENSLTHCETQNQQVEKNKKNLVIN